jgi:mycofactocin system creatininase family protein
MRLADAAWPDVPERPLVLVPVGSVEQHGPHLPLDTDSTIAAAVAAAVAASVRGPVLVAPPLVYGSSGEHQSFPGTVSIGTTVLRQVVIELVRSVRTWAGRVVLVNAHGSNAAALDPAVRQLCDEGHNVLWVRCATEDVDLHAGHTETSLMLHLRPGAVRLERAGRGNCGALAELLPAMRAGGVLAVSTNGVLGDPTHACAEEGERVLGAMADEISKRIAADAGG